MAKTGAQFVDDALKELQVLDPTATAEGEQLEDGLRAATDLLGLWRSKKLLIPGDAIYNFSLVSGTQFYTIGQGGALDTTYYPQSIVRWSVVPDGSVAHPVEIPMGRPANAAEWQLVRMKTQTGPYPRIMYFTKGYSAGASQVAFWPIPNNNNVDVRIHARIPNIVSLVAGTTYDLQPGAERALTLDLAYELKGRYGKAAVMTEELKERRKEALVELKRSNFIPKESQIRPEFIMGDGVGRRTFNIRTGGT